MSRLNALPSLALLSLLACGGGGNSTPTPPPPPTPKLVYTDPGSGTYRLTRNATLSRDGHLVLDLLGPTGAQGRGLAFTLTTDAAKVAWVKPETTEPELVVPATFDLGAAPQLFKVKAAGATLQAAFAQKGPAVSAKALDGTLARVALDLNPGAKGAVTLTATQAQVLPGSGSPQDIMITPGNLQIQ